MEIFWKNQVAWIASCLVISKDSSKGKNGQVHVDVQKILDKHSLVFSGMPPEFPPNRGFHHIIKLELVS